eukprot:gnl/MRDRNA2_/MRDRNA2_34061_c0_seq1.p1 gnl/MRDRNA2_/MRDRNA2_34061_c0~~gnl/MRDRNA2_/MRDRNA2_34061_c0_seq1.p1  ORF type:complete len:422 (+),score=90.46 gnl/MRDRNA2_/MRDRNA2_34061_c0_seq1:67-1266(+)
MAEVSVEVQGQSPCQAVFDRALAAKPFLARDRYHLRPQPHIAAEVSLAAAGEAVLVSTLKNGDGKDSSCALRILRRRLEAPHAPVRLAAAEAFGQCGPGPAGAFSHDVVALLEDECPEVRVSALAALGEMCAYSKVVFREAVRWAVVRRLQDAAPEVREAAASTLGSIGVSAAGQAATMLRDPQSETKAAAVKALGLIGAGAGPHVAPYLRDSWAPCREAAANAIGEIGPSALAHASTLGAMLRDSSAEVREAAARALARLGPGAGVHASALLCDSGWRARTTAASALAQLGEDAAPHAAPLAGLLADEDPLVQTAAAKAVGQIGAAAVPYTLAQLPAGGAQARAGVAQALTHLHAKMGADNFEAHIHHHRIRHVGRHRSGEDRCSNKAIALLLAHGCS